MSMHQCFIFVSVFCSPLGYSLSPCFRFHTCNAKVLLMYAGAAASFFGRVLSMTTNTRLTFPSFLCQCRGCLTPQNFTLLGHFFHFQYPFSYVFLCHRSYVWRGKPTTFATGPCSSTDGRKGTGPYLSRANDSALYGLLPKVCICSRRTG